MASLFRRALAVAIIGVCAVVGAVGAAGVAGANQPVANQPVASQPVASQPVASQPVASQSTALAAADGGVLGWYCRMSGGVYYPGKYVAYCFYRDGKTIACYPGIECKVFTRARTRNATAG